MNVLMESVYSNIFAGIPYKVIPPDFQDSLPAYVIEFNHGMVRELVYLRGKPTPDITMKIILIWRQHHLENGIKK